KNRSLLNCKVGWRHAPPADLLSKMPPAFADDAEFPCIAHARRQALLKVQRELTIITTTITIIILGRAASVRAKAWTSALPLAFGSLRPDGLHWRGRQSVVLKLRCAKSHRTGRWPAILASSTIWSRCTLLMPWCSGRMLLRCEAHLPFASFS